MAAGVSAVVDVAGSAAGSDTAAVAVSGLPWKIRVPMTKIANPAVPNNPARDKYPNSDSIFFILQCSQLAVNWQVVETAVARRFLIYRFG